VATKEPDSQRAPQRAEKDEQEMQLPSPSPSYRRRAWIEFQRALDPLAPVKPLPPPRS
jgi:hypothetical protein